MTQITPQESFNYLQCRRSYCKDWTGERVDDDLIEQLLEAGTWAPTHRSIQIFKSKVLRIHTPNLIHELRPES